MKKAAILFSVLVLLACFGPGDYVFANDLYEEWSQLETGSFVPAANEVGKLPKVDAKAALLMDAKTGRVLYEKDGQKKLPIASTTKIMTAIIALERGCLDDQVTVSKNAASIWGSRIKLKAGEKLSLRDLLYGLLLNSGNDAAIAIAEHIGGSVEAFVEMMNQKAEELGAFDTHFVTPHGLDVDGHYSTAYDLALITRYALNNSTLAEIVKMKTARIPGRSLSNTNELLWLYQGADGVKTGYTGKAGRCLVASATRDDFKAISVVLGCLSRSARARNTTSILNYAFNNYSYYRLMEQGRPVARVEVVKGVGKTVDIVPSRDIELPLTPKEAEDLELKLFLPEKLEAPVIKGRVVGKAQYLVNGQTIELVELETAVDIRRRGIMDYMRDIFGAWVRLLDEAA